ncbi:MAG: urease accessory protein UreD [Opitutales bacterium]|jgi:urease accessory protein|nr:urease accessory protein UreD [Opitutales bacterium]
MPPVTIDAISGRPAVSGGARLRYVASAEWGTRLMEQWVRPPLHLAKAYHESDWAISLLTSPTAGLLDGDLLEVEATIEAGAKAALISPAACRVHTMASGHATVRQHYTVGAGAVLDVWPAPLILQKDASIQQTTQLDVAADATVLLCEVVTPGRAAFGEAFEFTEWRSKLRIYRDGDLLAYENFSCIPSKGDVADWRLSFPSGSYASLYFLCPEPLGDFVQTVHDLVVADAAIGASPLRAGGLGVKILATDGISLRKAIFSVRNLLITHSKIKFPQALQRAQTFFN